MRNEVIDGTLDALAGAQIFQIAQHQCAVEGVRMIEIDLMPLIERHGVQIAIIGILLQIGDIRVAD